MHNEILASQQEQHKSASASRLKGIHIPAMTGKEFKEMLDYLKLLNS
jgi:hypothetical protein